MVLTLRRSRWGTTWSSPYGWFLCSSRIEEDSRITPKMHTKGHPTHWEVEGHDHVGAAPSVCSKPSLQPTSPDPNTTSFPAHWCQILHTLPLLHIPLPSRHQVQPRKTYQAEEANGQRLASLPTMRSRATSDL